MFNPMHKFVELECDYLAFDQFSASEINATEEFTHEFAAASYRLCQTLPIKIAAPFIGEIFAELGRQLTRNSSLDPLRKIGTIACDYPKVKHMSTEQLAALHAFKHELVAAGYRLYQKLPTEHAKPFMSARFVQFGREIEIAGASLRTAA